MRLDGKADGFGGGIYNVLRVDDGADGRSFAAFMGGDDTDISSHNFDTAQITAQRSVIQQQKTFGADTHSNILVGHIFYRQDGIPADIQRFAFDNALKDIDWRGA